MIIENLQTASHDVTSLQNYLSDNFEQVYDFFTHQKHSNLLASRNKLNGYIQSKRSVILQLDISDKKSLAFISLLLNLSEELGLLSSFHFLYKHLQSNDYNIGERLKAASLYLIHARYADDYVNKYEIIYDHLRIASEEEEDNTDRVLMTIVNYYAKAVSDFGQFNINTAKEIRAKIENSISDFEYSFLHNKLIKDVLSIDLNDFDVAYARIHSLLDLFLGRNIVKPNYKEGFLIETETEYCNLLAKVDGDFKKIRGLSVKKYQSIKSDLIFNSLNRGVAILTDENQLYAYMNSYGDMHYEKLIKAFKEIPTEFFEKETNIIDWGCGQAMASMTYFDFLNQNKIKQKVKNISLIEPSEIALKRASLHIRNFNIVTEIHTINKDLDSLDNQDFIKNTTSTNIHLFSNILDMEQFSLTNLLRLIESNFRGDNYFICVSPYINDTRTSRLDAFVQYLSKKENFKMVKSIDNKYGEWKRQWTRVVRIFQVSL